MSCRSRPTPVNAPARPPAAAGGFLSLFLLLALITPRADLGAQSSAAREVTQSTIYGRVTQADNQQPLGAAQIYVESIDSLTHFAPATESGPIRAFRMARTDREGQYVLHGLDSGAYRIHIRAAGFKSAAVDVELDGGGLRLSTGLEFSPIPLSPVEVTGQSSQPYVRTLSAEAAREGAGRSVVVDRQADYLPSDVRALTAGDVLDAITLAEPDLFRALQRLPGVSRRDDYTAVLWTRGAPWDQTRVYFDGLPLYNPTHGGWLFAAINPDGIGSAVFQPGVRSAEWGEGAAAVLDLRSRSGGPEGVLNGRAELSLASGKLAMDGRLPGGATWLLAGRRTYVDLLTSAWDSFGGNDESEVPYDFSDLIGRVDVPLPLGVTLEASALVEKDRLRGNLADILDRNRADWGNRVGRITARADIGIATLSGTVGRTRFATNVDYSNDFNDPDVPTLSPLENTINHDVTSLRIEDVSSGSGSAWALGFDRVREQVEYSGPFSLTSEGIPGLPIADFDLVLRGEYDAAWGQFRFGLFDSIDLETGLRVELGDSVRNGGETRVAPRLSGRWRIGDSMTFSGGWGRSFQYTQAIGASGGPLGPQLHIGNLWVLATVGYPALRSDVFSLGAEAWFLDDWLISANTYRREASGITEPDRTPGQIRQQASHIEATSLARGLELSLQKPAGSWTGSLGYAFGESETSAIDLTFPSSADVRHTFDLTSAYRFRSGLRVGGAFSFASGIPYTRILVDEDPLEEEASAFQGDPNGERTPAYAGFDLALDYTTRVGEWNVDMFVQLLNVFNRANAVTYAGSRCLVGPPTEGEQVCPSAEVRDDFKAGLPRLPLIGFRVAF